MTVDRVPRLQKSSDKAYARRSAREKVQWAIDNAEKLKEIRNGNRYLELAKSIRTKIDAGEELQEWQYQDADNCYEMTMKALGLPSVPKRHDNRKSLRHPT